MPWARVVKGASGHGRTLGDMEYEIRPNPSSPGYDYLATGHDMPVFAKWAHDSPSPVSVNQEAADMVKKWVAKYDAWPESMAPVHLVPIDRSL